ncbi:hypothetical protein ABMC89_09400 [Sulfitobacter sp. HNIBRBA3233]|uniref:hypothetical protein n=1 Tax=Sulfitobacter marinivivus TaxID=3158558 RepID=UPI0032DF43D1
MKPERQLHIEVGQIRFPVLRTWSTGFAADARAVPALSGVVDVFDGKEHLYQGLIVAVQENDDERIFEVKRANSSHLAGVLEADVGIPSRGYKPR